MSIRAGRYQELCHRAAHRCWIWTHDQLVHRARVRRLTDHVLELLPAATTILDVGCGDGAIARQLALRLPTVEVRGLDVLVRPDAGVAVEWFDGSKLPLPNASVDVCLLIDVLHHAQDPELLLREVRRVSRRAIIVKDHLKENMVDDLTLRFMDWLGNAQHGVALPYGYLSRAEWRELYERIGLRAEAWTERPSLYGVPGDLLFGRGLHFIARFVADVAP